MSSEKTKDLYGPTVDGLRLYKPTKVWHINKWVLNKTVQASTERTGKKEAKEFLEDYIARLNEGKDPTVTAPEPEKSEEVGRAKDAGGSGRSFTFLDSVDCLSTTIAGKQQEGQITSLRSPEYASRM